jgi:hypothetical protein
MIGLGRMLIFAGVALIVIGGGVILWQSLGLPSRLPGDITYRRGPVTVYFPIVTCIVLSVLLTLLLNLFLRRR